MCCQCDEADKRENAEFAGTYFWLPDGRMIQTRYMSASSIDYTLSDGSVVTAVRASRDDVRRFAPDGQCMYRGGAEDGAPCGAHWPCERHPWAR